MLNFNRFAIILLLLFTFSACTKSGEFYDKAKHTKEDFSVTNTVLGVAGAALAVPVTGGASLAVAGAATAAKGAASAVGGAAKGFASSVGKGMADNTGPMDSA